MPEYILAYLIMSMLGSPAWPAVLALAIHNTGILGRLHAETIENVERRPLAALRALVRFDLDEEIHVNDNLAVGLIEGSSYLGFAIILHSAI